MLHDSLMTNQYHEDYRGSRAVVLPERVSVRSGLAENATELFVLHAGTSVQVEKEDGPYTRIYFSKGKIGWVRKNQIGLL